MTHYFTVTQTHKLTYYWLKVDLRWLEVFVFDLNFLGFASIIPFRYFQPLLETFG